MCLPQPKLIIFYISFNLFKGRVKWENIYCLGTLSILFAFNWKLQRNCYSQFVEVKTGPHPSYRTFPKPYCQWAQLCLIPTSRFAFWLFLHPLVSCIDTSLLFFLSSFLIIVINSGHLFYLSPPLNPSVLSLLFPSAAFLVLPLVGLNLICVFSYWPTEHQQGLLTH